MWLVEQPAGIAGRQVGFWDVEHRLRQLSERGDPLEKLAATVDFVIFRTELVAALGFRDRAKDGRRPFDPVLKFRMLVLRAMHGLAQAEFLVAGDPHHRSGELPGQLGQRLLVLDGPSAPPSP
jgi:hypothetical protein